MVPIVQGRVHHFGPRGLYDGLVLLGDDETHSYWNHVTGECVHGPLKGENLPVFPIEHTDVKSALSKYEDLPIALSSPSLKIKLLSKVLNRGRKKKEGFLPPGFRKTMKKVDDTLPEMTSGLGVSIDEVQRFYPVETIKENDGIIQDKMNGREIIIEIDDSSQVPVARYVTEADEEKPMQLFTRWYGFNLTYPEGEVYKP